MDLTFIIPTRIESEDRLRNIIASVSYILKHTDAKIIVKEVSSHNTFLFRALPLIKKYVDTTNLKHIFEESNEKLFCKSKVLNDLIVESDTKFVANYDTDCILPVESYREAYNLLESDQADVVYPYQCGIYQWRANFKMNVFNSFMNTLSTDVLDKDKSLSNSTIGWTQFVNREKYIQSYMMNENFISWGCEDDEFYFRMSTLGNRIARINNYVYHLEHSRTYNSWFSNPNFNENYNLWSSIRKFDRTQLIDYYKDQEYLKKRKKQLA